MTKTERSLLIRAIGRAGGRGRVAYAGWREHNAINKLEAAGMMQIIYSGSCGTPYGRAELNNKAYCLYFWGKLV